MISLEVLRDLYNYNFWARDQQLAVCAALSEEQLARPLGSSFGSPLSSAGGTAFSSAFGGA